MKYYILAFDPGLTTGVAFLELRTTQRAFDLILVDQVRYENKSRFEVLFTLDYPLDAVVVEDWRLRSAKAKEQIGLQMIGPKAIGMLETFHFIYRPEVPFFFQQPAQRQQMKVIPEHKALLRGKRHAVDAYLHAIYHAWTVVRAKTKK